MGRWRPTDCLEEVCALVLCLVGFCAATVLLPIFLKGAQVNHTASTYSSTVVKPEHILLCSGTSARYLFKCATYQAHISSLSLAA